MDAIPIESYRRRRRSTLCVREARGTDHARRVGPRCEHTPGDRVLCDLARTWDDPFATGRVLARFAAVRVVYGGPDRAECLGALDEWSWWLEGTVEGRALRTAIETVSSRERYCALGVAAAEAARLGHEASALALRALMFDIAIRARMRRAAAAAARAASRCAAEAGAVLLARRWSRRAERLRRTSTPA